MVELKYKAGLVMNTREDNIYSNTIQIGLGNYWSHTCWIREVKGDMLLIQEALGNTTKQVTSTWKPRTNYDTLFENNRLKVMDFGIRDDAYFKLFCNDVEGTKYDYFSIFEIAITRLLRMLGLKRFPETFLRSRVFTLGFYKLNSDFKPNKRMDCSELISRGLNHLLNIDVLGLLKKEDYDYVTPQLVSVLYDKLQLIKNDKK